MTQPHVLPTFPLPVTSSTINHDQLVEVVVLVFLFQNSLK
ncbi:hypothetical protein NP493_1427g01005 [Ridgeia piscesae]|uniref:Uncharacterized protein n=1 Tax=Ridgeia piscesae TaxID=27915 RepID=A0AAD9K4Y2_RIDPI|nr:hypothetical protein NP493_1427g01005 [Ridgeia piscesae]